METTLTPEPQRGLTFEDVWASLQELRESIKETDRQMKETNRQMKETDRKIGELGNRFGELAEHLVGPSIMEKFNTLGFNFTERSSDKQIKNPNDPNACTEVDILLENGEIVIAVEVKSKPKHEDVNDHLKRMKILRRVADRRGDNRIYRGAVAGAIMSDSLCNYIIKKGFYLIEQTGDTVKITVPEGFTPRDW